MSENEKVVAVNLDDSIYHAAKDTKNPWVALFTGILLKHGVYACAFVIIAFAYMEKDKSYQASRDQELERYINIIQRNTTATERSIVVSERLMDFLDREAHRPVGQR